MHIPFPVHSHLRCKSTIFIHHRQGNRRKGRPATPLSEASSASASRPIYMEPHVSSMCNHVFHIRGTICFIYVEQSVPRMWNCVFHLRGTVRSTYVDLCVPPTWNCMFHLRGTMFHLRGAERSTYWNCEFHILELCVPKHGTLLEHCGCCGRGRHRARFAARGASFVNED